jgi:hypothetical protein
MEYDRTIVDNMPSLDRELKERCEHDRIISNNAKQMNLYY